MSKIRPDSVPPGDGFDLLRELIGDAGDAITFPASKIPHAAARRLLETLGVTIVEDRGRWRDRQTFELDEPVRRYVQAALERQAARGVDPRDPLEAHARKWAA